jgi:diadenylate cyclase
MAEGIKEIWGQLARMQWSDYLDIILVAFVIYMLLPMVRSTGATRILRVVVFILVAAWVTELLKLHTMNFLLQQVLAVGLIAIVILYQPELRRVLDRLTSVKLKKLFIPTREEEEMSAVITQTVMACQVMSQEHVGALIVFGRDSVLEDYTKTGTALDAQVSEQLLRNIFFPKAALHDGASIIHNGRVVAAGCVLPLSDSNRLHADLGTRHRAGVGMSEISDAVVVIVSEETGGISVAVGGILKRSLTPQSLEKILRNELCPQEMELQKDDNQMWVNLKQKIKTKKKEEQTDDQE